jgi:hypothetical protein
MSDEAINTSAQQASINLIRMDDGRWRVLLGDEDTGAAYQFPWDALQCALNGSLTGRPLEGLRTIKIEATTVTDDRRVARRRPRGALCSPRCAGSTAKVFKSL